MPNDNEAFKTLLTNVVGLYVNGTLMQYGLTEEQALEIVSNVTRLPKDRLVELREARNNNLAEVMQQSNEALLNTLGVGSSQRGI